MTSSRRVELSDEAEDDFRSLLAYTAANFRTEQRDFYADRLVEIMQELLKYPQIGSARDDVAAGIRSRRADQHVIFYRVSKHSIQIVRILHAKRNLSAELDRSP